jgi:hypothetical protein
MVMGRKTLLFEGFTAMARGKSDILMQLALDFG